MTEVVFRLPTFERLKMINKHRRVQSILRCLEYERMSELNLQGRVLDFGGGSKTNYSDHVSSWGEEGAFDYESANIDPATAPSYLIAEAGNLPVEADEFDAVVSLNTFEHVYSLDVSLAEISRVLKPGGSLTFIVPFVFRVHGHPNDYHRGTPSFWERKLSEHGFGGVQIEALAWGPFSTATTVSGLPGPFKGMRQWMALMLDLIYAKLRWKKRTSVRGEQDAPLVNAPMGYFIQAIKS